MLLEIDFTSGWSFVVNYDALKHKVDENPTTSTRKLSEEQGSSKYNFKSIQEKWIKNKKKKLMVIWYNGIKKNILNQVPALRIRILDFEPCQKLKHTLPELFFFGNDYVLTIAKI